MIVKPRPASTVVLMDECSRVYMTKRPNTMKFFGGYYVFPGGAVEESDYWEGPEILKTVQEGESIPSAHYIAAARELFEEVGVLLCQTKDGKPAVLKDTAVLEYRRLMVNGELTFLQMIKQEGLKFHMRSLTPFGHLITPEVSKIRFDTRFFLAHLPTGQTPAPDENEVGEACWLSPVEALAAFQEEKILLAPPTVLALKTIYDYLNGGPLHMPQLQGDELFNYKLQLKSE
ncbi:NUDIX hydrolase [Bacillus sp. BRMEA1]|uniref:NUDIX hydrolase n=1 Tax=Neobacillus endophyticus TaxID=2738405 RepID=UPI0015660199|nr:NUDIX hydrolase [Neobacillus endophyticus]NRD79670.1 NUDIX hydrolase [Neobacillus endophyticus]